MKKISSILFILLFVVSAFAQGKVNTDSLIRVAEQYPKDDTVKVKIWLKISEALVKVNATQGLEYANKALEKLPAPALKALALVLKGRHLESQGKCREAIVVETQSAEIYESLHDKKGQAIAEACLGSAYLYLSEAQTAKQHNEKSLTLYEQIGDKNGITAPLMGLGNIMNFMGDYAAAITFFDRIIQIEGANQNLKTLARTLSNKAISYNSMGEYNKSIECVQKALRINESIGNNYSIIFNCSAMGTAYLQLKEYPNAIKYFSKGIALAETLGNKKLEAEMLSTLGIVYTAISENEKAISYFKKAIEIQTVLDDKGSVANNLTNLAAAYKTQKAYYDAYLSAQKALAVHQKNGDKSAMGYCLVSLSEIYLAMPDSALRKLSGTPINRLAKVEDYAQQGLDIASAIKSTKLQEMAWESLSSIYEAQKEYAKAYDAFKKHIVLKDSIAGDEVKKQITRKEIQYEFDKKETVLLYEQKLTSEQLAKQKALTEQQQQSLTLKDQLLRIKEQALTLQKQALLLANKEKDLQHLAFLEEEAEKQKKEQALLLVEKDKDLATAKVFALAKEKALQIQEIARKNATIGFLGASLLAILLASTIFYLLQQRKQAQKQAAQQAQFTQQLLATTEEERGRIARDLHDGISHELLGLRRELSQTDAKTSKTNTKIDGIIEDVRQISRNLHPVMLDTIGLKLSLETLCEQFGEREALFVSYNIDYTTTLSKNTELQLFRIVQEALTNTVKYANANASNVIIHEIGGKLHLNITDNGKGFDVQKRLDSGQAFGLHSIIQRAKAIGAVAKIDSSPKGTAVNVVLE